MYLIEKKSAIIYFVLNGATWAGKHVVHGCNWKTVFEYKLSSLSLSYSGNAFNWYKSGHN